MPSNGRPLDEEEKMTVQREDKAKEFKRKVCTKIDEAGDVFIYQPTHNGNDVTRSSFVNLKTADIHYCSVQPSHS
jgi:hypothetical protein